MNSARRAGRCRELLNSHHWLIFTSSVSSRNRNLMAYNVELTERIRSQLEGIPVVEKKMFGGVGFLFNGNLACGVNKDDLIVRVDPERHSALLKKSHVKPFDLTGRPMKGWLLVEPEGV